MSTTEPPLPPTVGASSLGPLRTAPPGAIPPVADSPASAPPKPGWLLIISAVLVIAQAVLWISIMLAGCVAGDPFGIIAAVPTLPVAGVVGCTQYVAVARRSRAAARIGGIVLAVLSAFWLFALITNVAEGLINGVQSGLMIGFIAILSTIAAQLGIAAAANLRWARRLAEAPTPDVTHARTFTLRELFAIVSVIAITTGFVSAIVRSEPAQFGEHVDRSQGPGGLPAGATDVSFGRGHRGTIAYEFTIDEQGFIDWVSSGIGSIESQSAGIQILPINGSTGIRRYTAFQPNVPTDPSIVISNGLMYHWSKEDRGVHAVFDRDTNRAYYEAHYH